MAVSVVTGTCNSVSSNAGRYVLGCDLLDHCGQSGGAKVVDRRLARPIANSNFQCQIARTFLAESSGVFGIWLNVDTAPVLFVECTRNRQVIRIVSSNINVKSIPDSGARHKRTSSCVCAYETITSLGYSKATAPSPVN